jgi:hypothetical protein
MFIVDIAFRDRVFNFGVLLFILLSLRSFYWFIIYAEESNQ